MGGTIRRLHRILGLGMDQVSVNELAGDHVESDERREGLSLWGHASFLANNVLRRLETPASADMGGHFMPALLVICAGIAVYLLGGKGASPESRPSWPMIPLALGVLGLIVQTSRTHGFPVRSGVFPALVAGFGAIADAVVMPISLPEEHLIRVGLVVLGSTGPAVFIMLARCMPRVPSWGAARCALADDRWLRLTWQLVPLGLALIAVGEVMTSPRYQQPNSVQVGALLMGLGLAWMARIFYVAGRALPVG